MGLFNRRVLSGPDREIEEARIGNEQDSRQRNLARTTRFPAIFGYVDTHPKDGYPDAPLAAFGSRYQLVQMLSLRNPEDTAWLQDSHQTPTWLRTSPSVREEQRMGLSPASAASPYQVAAWHATTYRGVPNVGHGPGTVLVLPLVNQNQVGIND